MDIMDINCTNQCAYQHEGKCTLGRLPSLTSQASSLNSSDCPYFSSGMGMNTLR